MKIKSVLSLSAGISLLAISIAANAEALSINNKSSAHLSFFVEQRCSNEFGTVNAKTVKKISEEDLKSACKVIDNHDKKKHCHIRVYDQPNCSGVRIENIELTMKDGIFLLEGGDPHPDTDYSFYASKFYLQINSISK